MKHISFAIILILGQIPLVARDTMQNQRAPSPEKTEIMHHDSHHKTNMQPGREILTALQHDIEKLRQKVSTRSMLDHVLLGCASTGITILACYGMRGSTPDVKAAILKSIASGGCILLASKRTPEGCYELSTSKLIAWTLGVIAGTTIGGKIWFIKPNGKIILRQPSCKKMLEEVN